MNPTKLPEWAVMLIVRPARTALQTLTSASVITGIGTGGVPTWREMQGTLIVAGGAALVCLLMNGAEMLTRLDSGSGGDPPIHQP